MDNTNRGYRLSGFVTCSILTEEETKMYSAMPVGVTQTADMIRVVVENDEEKRIFEQTAYGLNRISIKKTTIGK